MRLVNFKEKLKKNSFFKSVFTLSAGTAISQVINIFFQPIISRLYKPEDVGSFASYFAVVSIIGTFSLGCYDSAVVLPKKDKEASAIVSLATYICIFVSVLITFFAFFTPSLLINWCKVSFNDYYWIYLIGFVILFERCDVLYTNFLVRLQEYKFLSLTRVIRQVLTGFLKIGFGLFTSLRLSALLISTILGTFVRVFMMLYKIRPIRELPHNRNSFYDIKFIAIKYKKFPFISIWSSLLNTASLSVPILLFSGLYSAHVSGLYSFAFSILGLPMTLIGSSIANVYMREAAICHADGQSIASMTLSLYKKLFTLACCMMSFITFYGAALFSLIFGKQWVEAGVYAQWMSIWLIFVFTFSPLSSIFLILSKQEEGLIADIILFFVRSLAIFISSKLLLSSVSLIAVFSLSSAIIWVFLGLRILRLAGVCIKYAFKILFFNISIIFGIQSLIYLIISYFFGV